ncbi:MAG: hypothetical protein HN742_04515 [Lentisphaerae bacterium]|nr:hypothetical protein [Lentisphaerota bacterium]MBT4817641.1 hypothetical protein [Lentisphaerota bacterium]MBT5611238.1 hypothetical protein [Lentisphaerota bacterium]MBT7057852.1 hypothetical protein [Lentisphaerota bacterium]MBT7841108.1 hypothetical protein [Lentisphaerota bacterium]
MTTRNSKASTERWIWRNIAIAVPRTWEMLQFSRGMDSGRCAFADRYQFRCELNWRTVPGPPDFDRMMSDYSTKLSEKGVEAPKALRLGSWRGVEGVRDGLLTSHYGGYLPGEHCLLELVLLWPDRKQAELERRIISSIREEPVMQGGLRHWQAFGMEAGVHTDVAPFLESCTVNPAHVDMIFRNRSKQREEHFARRGLVKQWLEGSVGDWLHWWLPKDFEMESQTSDTIDGHRLFMTTGTRWSWGIRRFFRQRLRCHAAAWICPQDERLYSVGLISHPSLALTDARAAAAMLSCCGQKGLGV